MTPLPGERGASLDDYGQLRLPSEYEASLETYPVFPDPNFEGLDTPDWYILQDAERMNEEWIAKNILC